MKRALKITALVLAGLLVLVVAVFSWVWWTPAGSRFALARLEGVLPEGFDLGTVHGRFADHLEFENGTVALDGLRVTFASLWLDWRPGELLRGRLHVAELGARGVHYQSLPSQPAPEPGEPLTVPERIALPIAVAVDRVTVRNLALYASPDAAPTTVDRALIAGVSFVDSRLKVETIELDAPALSARGALSLTATDDYPLDAHLDWRLEPADYAALDGATRLSGSLAALDVNQRIAAPYDLELAATASHLVDGSPAPSVSGHLDVPRVRLQDVQPGLPDASVSAQFDVDGPVGELNVRGRISGTDPQSRQFVASLDAEVLNDAVDLRELTLRQPERQGRLNGEGRIGLDHGVVADVTLQWSALQWPLTGAEPTIVSPRGEATLKGPLDDYHLALDTRLEPAAAPPVDLHVAGDGSLHSATLALRASVGSGTLNGHVKAAWDPSISADVRLEARDLDPSPLAADWPGAVNVDLSASARTRDGALHVTLDRLQAGGRLRDQPLTVEAHGQYVQTDPWPTVVVDRFDAGLGDDRVHAEGTVAETADLDWRVAIDDLSRLLPDAGGGLSGSGHVSGRLPRVSATATLDAHDLAYAGDRLDALNVDATLDLNGDTESHLDVVARGASLAGTVVRELTVKGDGRPAEHRLDLVVDADTGHARLGLTGRMEDPWGEHPVWHFNLADGELGYGQLAPWQLESSADGSVSADSLALGRQCWRASSARVCLQGHKDPNAMGGDLALTDLDFAYFAPFLPEGMEATGALNGTARVSQPQGGAMTAQANLQTTAGRLTVPPADDDAAAGRVAIALEPSSVILDLDESRARARVALNLARGRLFAQADTSATVIAGPQGAQTQRPAGDQSVEGRVKVDVPDLAFVSDLVPAAKDVKGRVSGDLNVAGTLGAPLLTGSLELNGGAVTVPEAGITLSDLSAAVTGRGRQVALAAAATSGDGNIDIDGSMNLPGQDPDARLAIKGHDFQVANNDEATVYVSPNLTVEAGSDRVTIAGEVRVPKAEVTPGTPSASAETVSDDQVLVSDNSDLEQATQRQLFARVRVIMGDDVHFEGFGLKARIEGNVLVDQQPDTPTTATGELDILDGEYRAYGQGLVIDKGRIYFAGGPVTQPALDIRAIRRPKEGILVGAHVQGTIDSPTFELFSDPSMTQQEQLSYLVLGRSLDETPDGQQSALSRAALALGLKGGDFLARNIGQAVGLDQIGIETGSGEAGAPSDPNDASLVVGKYLSPKLYVSYGIGLFNPESVLEMQYEISHNWKLVTQSSGESTGADVLYTVEVGGGNPGPGDETGQGGPAATSDQAERTEQADRAEQGVEE